MPRARRAISKAPSGSIRQPEDAGRTADDGGQVLAGVELQALDDAEAVAQRVGQHAGAGGGADQGEGRQVELDRAGSRALADHDVELEVLHGRIEHFLDHRRQAMDLVDEQHVARLQVGQQRRQIARALQHRPRGALDRHAHFLGDDVGQGGLAQPRRAEDQGVVEGFAGASRSLDEQLHLLAHHRLADVFGQRQGADGAVQLLVAVAAAGGNQTVGFNHRSSDHALEGSSGSFLRWTDPPP